MYSENLAASLEMRLSDAYSGTTILTRPTAYGKVRQNMLRAFIFDLAGVPLVAKQIGVR